MSCAIPDGLEVIVSAQFGTPALYYADEGHERIYLHPEQDGFATSVDHVCRHA
ncbi:hypothetical protein [Streptomyces sp. NPDC058657]|uniref:hypothetical protein n=1 Tax=unclassified Streptomyces TaxID=2593676 RepID=UPI003648A817